MTEKMTPSEGLAINRALCKGDMDTLLPLLISYLHKNNLKIPTDFIESLSAENLLSGDSPWQQKIH